MPNCTGLYNLPMFSQRLYTLLLTLFLVAVPAWFVVRSFYKHKTGIAYTFLQLGFFLYCITVLAVTIVPLPFAMHKTAGVQGINLVPLKNTIAIVQNAIHANKDFLLPHLMQNILGNIVLFIPLGFLVRRVAGNKFSLLPVLFTGFLASMAIESIQWIERAYGVYRSVDIDDVILNTTGTLVGWWLYLFTRRTGKPAEKRE